jgi:4-amino-4-deoxy-L-arabinose transferase-like glycosyltransferase
MSFTLKKHHQVLLLVTCIGLFLRVYALADNPVALNQDEAVNGYDAYALGLTLRDHHGNFLPLMLESFGDWASPLLTYLTVPFMRVLGLSEFSTRLPVALLGTASIPLIYILTNQLFAKPGLALLSAFLLSIMPWSIFWSRFAIPPSVIPFFLLLFLISFTHLLHKLQAQRPNVDSALIPAQTSRVGIMLPIAATTVTAVLLTYSYPTQKLFVPLFLFCAILQFFWRRHLKSGIYLFTSYLLLVAPLYLPSFFDPKYGKRFNDVSLYHSGQNFILGFFYRYTSSFLPDNFFGRGDRNITFRVPNFGNVYEFLSIFFYIGCLACLWVIFKRQTFGGLKRSTAIILGLGLVLFPIPRSLTVDYYHTPRGIHGLPFVVLLIAAGLLVICEEIKRIQIRQWLIGTLIFLCVANGIGYCSLYFTAYPALSKAGFQFGIKPVMAYIIAHEQEYKKVVIDNHINQPYVYVLFYTQFAPSRLGSPEIESYLDSEGWFRVRKLDKYEFKSIATEEVAKYQLVYQVADTEPNPGFSQPDVWFNLYRAPNQTLVIQKGKSM